MGPQQPQQVSDYAGAFAPWQLSSFRLVYIANLLQNIAVRMIRDRYGIRSRKGATGKALALTPLATNREIEVKLRVGDLPALVRRILCLSAAIQGRVFEQNTLYHTRDSDLRRLGYLLRLRRETPLGCSFARPGLRRAVLTCKAPPLHEANLRGRVGKPRYKERLERERAVRNPDRWNSILRSLGFVPAFRYEKYRTSFRLQGLHVDLDETPVGVFLELEGTHKTIERFARALGYTHADYLQATYWDLYRAHCKRIGRAPKNMVFDT